MDDNKSKALQAALAQIEKQFGKGSIMKMGSAQIENDLQVVSTGSLGLDIALGTGGLPRGRVVEVYGPESSGKTTLCLHVVAEVQKAGGVADTLLWLKENSRTKLPSPYSTTISGVRVSL